MHHPTKPPLLVALPFALVVTLAILPTAVSAQPAADDADAKPIRVTVDNFVRAETDTYLAKIVSDGGLGRLVHEREPTGIEDQSVIRMNRDTLYSFGVFDLDVGPVTIRLPDAGDRFMALQVINQDHYTTDVSYAPDEVTLTRDGVGTRYAAVLGRTFADPDDPADLRAAHALQDAIEVVQSGQGRFEVPDWDPASLKAMRDALNAVTEASGGIDSARMFGSRDEVDPVQHLLGTAAGWGGNPRHVATYIGVTPERNDGETPYTLTLDDVPVDGFWSVSVYNEAGFFEPNPHNAYSVNNVTAERNDDGSVTIHFGGDEQAANFIPITPGWNYLLRLYRPREAILDGRWTPPEAEPVD